MLLKAVSSVFATVTVLVSNSASPKTSRLPDCLKNPLREQLSRLFCRRGNGGSLSRVIAQVSASWQGGCFIHGIEGIGEGSQRSTRPVGAERVVKGGTAGEPYSPTPHVLGSPSAGLEGTAELGLFRHHVPPPSAGAAPGNMQGWANGVAAGRGFAGFWRQRAGDPDWIPGSVILAE